MQVFHLDVITVKDKLEGKPNVPQTVGNERHRKKNPHGGLLSEESTTAGEQLISINCVTV